VTVFSNQLAGNQPGLQELAENATEHNRSRRKTKKKHTMKSTELTSPPEPSKTIAQTRLARHSTRPTAHPPPNTRPAQPLNQRSHQTRLTATKPETAENSKSREPPHPRETTENSTETADSFTKTGRVHQKRLRIPQKQPTCRETKRLTGNG